MSPVSAIFLSFDGAGLEHTLGIGLLVAARVTPLVWLAPWLSGRAISPWIRLSMILVLTIALTPLAAMHAPALDPKFAEISLLAAREIAIGAVFALAASLPFYALRWSGDFIDIWRGVSFAETRAALTGEPAGPLGELYFLAGIVAFLSLGGHRLAMAAFADMLLAAPIAAPLHPTSLSAVIPESLKLFAQAFAFSVMLAVPVGTALAVAELSLGIIGRVAPEFAFSLAAMPLRAVLGLAVALLAFSSWPILLPNTFDGAIRTAAQFIETLAR